MERSFFVYTTTNDIEATPLLRGIGRARADLVHRPGYPMGRTVELSDPVSTRP